MIKTKYFSVFLLILLTLITGTSVYSSQQIDYSPELITNLEGHNPHYTPTVVSNVTIAIVYTSGGLPDLHWNDQAKKGINDAIIALTAQGLTVSLDEACISNCNETEISLAIENFASSTTVYDLIIAIGFLANNGTNASAVSHPTQNFVIVDSYVDRPNVQSIYFKEHEGSFLAGALAAMVTTTNDIAILGGRDISLINRFLAGYESGARAITSDIIVRGAYSPDPDNPWNDIDGGYTVADTFVTMGSDVIFGAAGATGHGIFNKIEAHNNDGGFQAYAIGVDNDEDSFKPGHILTSMIKRIDVAVNQSIVSLALGTWTTGVRELGLLENGVGLSDMTHTLAEKNALYTGNMTRWDKIQEFTKNIASGEIVVPNTLVASDIQWIDPISTSMSSTSAISEPKTTTISISELKTSTISISDTETSDSNPPVVLPGFTLLMIIIPIVLGIGYQKIKRK